jgi:hypothetical protein
VGEGRRGADEPGTGGDLDGLGAGLREAWRAEQEAAARDAVEAFRHGRVLRDVLLDLAARGDRVRVVVAGLNLTGEVVGSSDDLAAIHTPTGRVDVHIGAVQPPPIQVVERVRRGGRRPEAVPSLRARLLELEAAQQPVRVLIADGTDAPGTLEVGADHVVVTSADAAVVVKLAAIAAVVVASPDS